MNTGTNYGVITLKKEKINTTFLHLDSNHVSKYMYNGVKQPIAPEYHTASKTFLTGLTPEEETMFEAKLGLKPGTLGKYNEEYWANYANYVSVGKEGTVLNPDTNWHDYLKYKWLSAQPQVATSRHDFEENYSSKQYLMEAETAVNKNKAVGFSKKAKAFKLYSSLSLEDKKDFMISLGMKIVDHSEDSIDAWIGENYIETKPEEFVAILEDDNYKIKQLIFKAVNAGFINKKGTKFHLEDGELIGNTLQQTIDFLKDPVNQEIEHLINTRLKIKKK